MGMGHQSILSANSRIGVKATITFDGTPGHGAAGTPVVLFETSGDVLVKSFAVKVDDLDCGPSNGNNMSYGTRESQDIISLPQEPTSSAAARWLLNNGPFGNDAALLNPYEVAINGDVILTIGGADWTAGVMTVYAFYEPLSEDGALAPA